ncbi:hypothetical protein B0H21DRAFT_763021 [Amylocystis lapponica]|nr:hypothetical protein B0H21DRAFT_763021 [Amylocystis lapponica]
MPNLSQNTSSASGPPAVAPSNGNRRGRTVAPETGPPPKRARGPTPATEGTRGASSQSAAFLNPFPGRTGANPAPQVGTNTGGAAGPGGTQSRTNAPPTGTGNKSVADLITRLRTELAKLTALQAQQEAGMEIGIQVEGFSTTRKLGERVLALENRLAEFLHRFSALEKAVDELQVGGVMQHANPADEGDAKPRKRNNALQVVRACLYGYMGITKATPPPEPLPDGRFWTEDDPESPDRLLRPHWDEWSENQVAWLREMVHAVQDKGYKYSNSMTSRNCSQGYRRENHRAEWQYQSTDESDNEGGAIDANTDNESDDEVPVVTNSRQRPWKSALLSTELRSQVNEQLRILDKRVVAEQLNSSNQGNAHHARVIPRTMASLMAPEDEVEVEVGGEGDENVGEDVQEEMYWPIDPCYHAHRFKMHWLVPCIIKAIWLLCRLQ